MCWHHHYPSIAAVYQETKTEGASVELEPQIKMEVAKADGGRHTRPAMFQSDTQPQRYICLVFSAV